MAQIVIPKNQMNEFRFQKKLTLDLLYLKTGINVSKLSRLERALIKPTEREKTLIAEALDTSVKEIFPET